MEVGNKVDVTDPGGGVERGKRERGEGLVCARCARVRVCVHDYETRSPVVIGDSND